MRLLLSFLLVILIGKVAAQEHDWAGCSVYEKANVTTPRGSKAVFMGNSITYGWVSTHKSFFTNNDYIGRGISGQVTSQMLVRFYQDVVELEPKAVVILAGTNDIARNNGYISMKNIFTNIVSMVEIAEANKIKVVLCSVVPASKFGWREGINPSNDIKALNKMIEEYAKAHEIPYVDYHSALTDDQGGLPLKYAADGVHPNLDAYIIMESLVKPVIDKL